MGSGDAVPRLGVPSLKFQDAAQGFRTLDSRAVGQVTSWPCLLALAATWDTALSRRLGAALGREFRAKGANGILGPSVNVRAASFPPAACEVGAVTPPRLRPHTPWCAGASRRAQWP